uniref:Uncharacterized protein n=1 Tax=Crocodylus porosus TaxID=8502 RepID=A0A7M4ETM9_CROPO
MQLTPPPPIVEAAAEGSLSGVLGSKGTSTLGLASRCWRPTVLDPTCCSGTAVASSSSSTSSSCPTLVLKVSIPVLSPASLERMMDSL